MPVYSTSVREPSCDKSTILPNISIQHSEKVSELLSGVFSKLCRSPAVPASLRVPPVYQKASCSRIRIIIVRWLMIGQGLRWYKDMFSNTWQRSHTHTGSVRTDAQRLWALQQQPRHLHSPFEFKTLGGGSGGLRL